MRKGLERGRKENQTMMRKRNAKRENESIVRKESRISWRERKVTDNRTSQNLLYSSKSWFVSLGNLAEALQSGFSSPRRLGPGHKPFESRTYSVTSWAGFGARNGQRASIHCLRYNYSHANRHFRVWDTGQALSRLELTKASRDQQILANRGTKQLVCGIRGVPRMHLNSFLPSE